MANPVLLDNLGIYFGGYALQGDAARCSFKLSSKELDDRRFGDALDAKYPGVRVADLSIGGFWNSTHDGIIHPKVAGTRQQWPLTLAPPYAPTAAPGADGNVAYLMEGYDFAYELGAQHGDLLPYTLKRMPGTTARCVRGQILLPSAVVSATTTGTAWQVGALSATQEMYIGLHVFAVTGGSWVLTIESDSASNFPSPAVQSTFTAATAITYQVKRVAGAVTDTWWRAVLTKTGGTSCNAAVVAGIANLS